MDAAGPFQPSVPKSLPVNHLQALPVTGPPTDSLANWIDGADEVQRVLHIDFTVIIPLNARPRAGEDLIDARR